MTETRIVGRPSQPSILDKEASLVPSPGHSWHDRFPDRVGWDVIVVGAGPAGSMISRLLARRGHSILLIDAKTFPRDKVCGGCLSARAVAHLAQAGLGNLPIDAGAVPLDSFEVHVRGTFARFPINGGYSLSRRALDQHLLNAAIAEGVQFVPQSTAVVEKACVAGRRLVTIRRGAGVMQFDAACVVCADGLLRSAARQLPELAAETTAGSHLGIGACVTNSDLEIEDRVRPGTIVMAVGRDGYAGLAQCEQGRLSIAAAIAPASLKSAKCPEIVLEQLLKSVGLPFVSDAGSVDWQGTPLLTSQASTVATERVFVIGDAAGYVEPFTGEGMATALESAWLAAPLVDQAVRQWDPQLAQRWQFCYLRAIRHRQWLVRTLGTLLRYPQLARPLLQLCELVPAAPRWLIAKINNPRPSSVPTEGTLCQ